MRSVTVRGVVPATPEQVFDLLLDSRNDERWCPMASDYELVEGDGPGVGAVYRYTQQAGPGRTTTMHLRTTVAERPTRLAWDDGGRPGPDYLGEVHLGPHDGGTHVTHTNRLTMASTVEQALWFLSAQVVLRVQLRNLARLFG